eukprot:GFUD01006660.1.p1 GENE.GFUD01006660.1~~GFUD01006660.1.p1  ORF type:complete len:350 (-),score=54.64 GFUD01006660.1:163-1212(-)
MIGIIQSLLCLTGIFGQEGNLGIGELNWKNRKNVHHRETLKLGKTITTAYDLFYFTEILSNESNFVTNLDTILIPRTVGSANHSRVREHISRVLSNSGWYVEHGSFLDETPHGHTRFTNVIATLDPAAPRRLVIACHYDSKIEPQGFLGATDSAVPCAMMLNMAKTMDKELELLKTRASELTLQFLFFDGEEAFQHWSSIDSIYGSRSLAAHWENEGYTSLGVPGNYIDRIDMFLLLDLIGAEDMTFLKLETSTSDWYDNLVRIEKSLKQNYIIGGSDIFYPLQQPAGIEDDHIPFKHRGVPILHLIAIPFPPAWHKIGDNRDSLDFPRMANLNKILRVFVAEYLHLKP